MDFEESISFRSRVYLVSLIYVAYAVATLVSLSLAAATDDPHVITGTSIVPIVCGGLHFITSTIGSVTTTGRAALMIDPVIVILFSDWMQAAALGAIVTAIALSGDIGQTQQGVVVASNGLVAAAQLSCFYKAAQLLDRDQYDQQTGEKLENGAVF